MKETFTDEKRLRRYLLDDLSDDEQVAIEERLLVDRAYLEQLQIVEEDLIDDYLREKLSPPERARFQQQFNTPARRQKIHLAGAFQNYLNTLPPVEYAAPSLFRRLQETLTQFVSPPVLRAAMAVLVLTFGAGVLWIVTRPPDARQGINALEDAYSAARPLEARLTGFPYARFTGTTAQVNAAKLQLADKVFRNLPTNKQEASALHALGNYHLTKKDFGAAAGYFRAALAANPDDVTAHIGFAVATLEAGQVESNKANAQANFDVSRTHLEQALKLKPDAPEALFNLALLHQKRQSWSEAERSWRLYLQKDPDSLWAQEARQYLDQASRAQQ